MPDVLTAAGTSKEDGMESWEDRLEDLAGSLMTIAQGPAVEGESGEEELEELEEEEALDDKDDEDDAEFEKLLANFEGVEEFDEGEIMGEEMFTGISDDDADRMDGVLEGRVDLDEQDMLDLVEDFLKSSQAQGEALSK